MGKSVNKVAIYSFKFIISFIIISSIAVLVLQPTRVSGESMMPTIENDDLILVNKLAYLNEIPNRGDIIVFKTNLIDIETNKNKNFVKRVIGLPGEHIVIKDNKVIIDDMSLSEEYLVNVNTYGDVNIIIPENYIFVMGDNRENSNDSRNLYIGNVSCENIIGKVTSRIFPIDRVGSLQ